MVPPIPHVAGDAASHIARDPCIYIDDDRGVEPVSAATHSLSGAINRGLLSKPWQGFAKGNRKLPGDPNAETTSAFSQRVGYRVAPAGEPRGCWGLKPCSDGRGVVR